jgi:hypothetical protein
VRERERERKRDYDMYELKLHNERERMLKWLIIFKAKLNTQNGQNYKFTT